jgi:hypothetical protein
MTAVQASSKSDANEPLSQRRSSQSDQDVSEFADALKHARRAGGQHGPFEQGKSPGSSRAGKDELLRKQADGNDDAAGSDPLDAMFARQLLQHNPQSETTGTGLAVDALQGRSGGGLNNPAGGAEMARGTADFERVLLMATVARSDSNAATAQTQTWQCLMPDARSPLASMQMQAGLAGKWTLTLNSRDASQAVVLDRQLKRLRDRLQGSGTDVTDLLVGGKKQ